MIANTIFNEFPQFTTKLFQISDTDSFLFNVKTEDFYADMGRMTSLYDTSNYPASHPLHSIANKATPGLFKDETAGKPIQEFCGLRAKLYSLKVAGKEGSTSWIEKSATAGTKRHIAKKELTHDKFVQVLREEKDTVVIKQNSIRSYCHRLFNVRESKMALSGIDDKRYVLPDGETRAIGHHKNKKTTTLEEFAILLHEMDKGETDLSF